MIGDKECLNCGKEFINTPKKRVKVFCNNTCRSNYWQKADRLEKQGKTTEQIISILEKERKANKKPKPIKVTNYLMPNSSITNFQTGEVIKNDTDKIIDVTAELAAQKLKDDVQKKISEIWAEQIPAHRNTSIGRRSWELEQKKRIQELKDLLK